MALIENLQTIKDARDDIKTAIENKGAVGVTDDITTYADLIDNISGDGSGDIKLFETQEQMQADPNPQEGDLAVVYRNEINNAQEDSVFSKATFPNTVILPEAFTGNTMVAYRSTGDSYFDCWGELSQTGFRLSGHGEEREVRIEYTSEDGITYTRTDGGDEEVDFGVEVQREAYEEWNDVIGYFIKVGRNTFEGLFECAQDITKYVGGIIESAIIDGNDVTYTETKQYKKEDIDLLLNYCKENYSNINQGVVLGINDKKLLFLRNTTGGSTLCININNYKWMMGDTIDNILYNIWDIDNKSFDMSEFQDYSSEVQDNYSNLYHIFSVNYNYGIEDSYYYDGEWSPMNIDYKVYELVWKVANNQLTLSNSDQLLPGKIAYGKNGIITGDDSIYENLDNNKIFNFITNSSKENFKVIYGYYNSNTPTPGKLYGIKQGNIKDLKSISIYENFISKTDRINLIEKIVGSYETSGYNTVVYVCSYNNYDYFYFSDYSTNMQFAKTNDNFETYTLVGDKITLTNSVYYNYFYPLEMCGSVLAMVDTNIGSAPLQAIFLDASNDTISYIKQSDYKGTYTSCYITDDKVLIAIGISSSVVNPKYYLLDLANKTLTKITPSTLPSSCASLKLSRNHITKDDVNYFLLGYCDGSSSSVGIHCRLIKYNDSTNTFTSYSIFDKTSTSSLYNAMCGYDIIEVNNEIYGIEISTCQKLIKGTSNGTLIKVNLNSPSSSEVISDFTLDENIYQYGNVGGSTYYKLVDNELIFVGGSGTLSINLDTKLIKSPTSFNLLQGSINKIDKLHLLSENKITQKNSFAGLNGIETVSTFVDKYLVNITDNSNNDIIDTIYCNPYDQSFSNVEGLCSALSTNILRN